MVKHPEAIAPRIVLAGIEVVLPVNQDAPQDRKMEVKKLDLVFLDGSHYFVVEAKDSPSKMKAAEVQLAGYASILNEHLEKHKITCSEITPVLAWITDYPLDSFGKEALSGYMRGQTQP